MFCLISSDCVATSRPPTVARARSRRQQAAQHADGGGFARAVGAEEAEDFAAADVELTSIHGDEIAEALDQVAISTAGILHLSGGMLAQLLLRTSAMNTSSSDGTMALKRDDGDALRVQLLRASVPGVQEQMQIGAGRLHRQHAGLRFEQVSGGALIGGFDFVADLLRSCVSAPCGVSQRIMRPWCIKPDAIAALGFIQIGGGDENRQAVAHQLIENGPEIAARNRIDAVGGLVQKQHLRLVQQRAHQRQLLFHAAGEIAGAARAERLHARHAQQALASARSRSVFEMPNRSA